MRVNNEQRDEYFEHAGSRRISPKVHFSIVFSGKTGRRSLIVRAKNELLASSQEHQKYPSFYTNDKDFFGANESQLDTSVIEEFYRDYGEELSVDEPPPQDLSKSVFEISSSSVAASNSGDRSVTTSNLLIAIPNPGGPADADSQSGTSKSTTGPTESPSGSPMLAIAEAKTPEREPESGDGTGGDHEKSFWDPESPSQREKRERESTGSTPCKPPTKREKFFKRYCPESDEDELGSSFADRSRYDRPEFKAKNSVKNPSTPVKDRLGPKPRSRSRSKNRKKKGQQGRDNNSKKNGKNAPVWDNLRSYQNDPKPGPSKFNFDKNSGPKKQSQTYRGNNGNRRFAVARRSLPRKEESKSDSDEDERRAKHDRRKGWK